MGMTTYMYAPKDDAKHRAFWRDLYSVEEAGILFDELRIDSYYFFKYFNPLKFVSKHIVYEFMKQTAQL